MKTKYLFIIFPVLLICLIGYSPVSASIRELFQKHRSDTDTRLYLNSGDILYGRVLNQNVGIYTPYGHIQMPIRKCAGIFFDGSSTNREMIVSEDMNRFTGIVDTAVIRFHIRSTDSEVEIRKEEIRSILLGFPRRRAVSDQTPPKAAVMIMDNGDLLTGQVALPSLALKVDGSAISVPFSDAETLDIFPGTAVRVEVKKTDGFVLNGTLAEERFPFHADIGGLSHGIYVNRISKIRLKNDADRIDDLFWKGIDIDAKGPRPVQAAAIDPEHLVNSIGMKFQLIHPGSFMMGSDDGRFDEKPAHRVTITKPFYMSVYETTQEAWEKIMGKNPSLFKGPKRPVESVNWKEAQEFCRKLSAAEGVHYRLPTEAEWEFVCRAGTLTRYFWGETFDGAYAWCWFNSDGITQPVGLKSPNPWGIYDIIGNVVEWCEDGFALYRPGEAVDPVISAGTTRTLRGGGWDSHPEICRSAFRLHLSPLDRSDAIGFRIVREQ